MELKEQYKQALLSLRPRGVIWENHPGSIAERESEVLAEEMAKVHQRTDKLIEESDFRTTEKYIETWENQFELPHEGELEDRRTALRALRGGGRQDIPFYESLCRQQGVEVEIVEYTPFMVGLSQCGGEDTLGDEDMVFYWDILVKSGSDEQITALKKTLGKIKQSHTVLTYYDQREE